MGSLGPKKLSSTCRVDLATICENLLYCSTTTYANICLVILLLSISQGVSVAAAAADSETELAGALFSVLANPRPATPFIIRRENHQPCIYYLSSRISRKILSICQEPIKGTALYNSRPLAFTKCYFKLVHQIFFQGACYFWNLIEFWVQKHIEFHVICFFPPTKKSLLVDCIEQVEKV